MRINDITITSLDTITAFDVVSGDYLFTLDELQNASIAQAEEKTDITGKSGRKLTSLKKNKSITVSGGNGLVSGGLMSLQTGGDFENKSTTVMWNETLTVKSSAAATTYKAVGTTGAEITALYIKNSDGTLGSSLTQSDTASTDKFKYTPATKALTFDTSVQDGTGVVVYYERKIKEGFVLNNSSEKHSGKASLYIDATGEDKCANVFRIQFFIPKADFSGEFTLEMGENQTVHNFESESLAGACGAGGAGDNLFTYTVFGANTEDAG